MFCNGYEESAHACCNGEKGSTHLQANLAFALLVADLEALATHYHLVVLTSFCVVTHRAVESSELVVCTSGRRESAPAIEARRKEKSRTSKPNEVVVVLNISAVLEHIAGRERKVSES